MKRVILETGLAAMIFFAANAVYGVDALFAGGLSGALLKSASPARAVKLDDNSAVRLPAPISLELGSGNSRKTNFEYSLCIGTSADTRELRVSTGDRVHALISNDTALPYSLDVAFSDALERTLMNTGNCDAGDNVTLSFSIDEGSLSLVSDQIFTDTVVLIVDPE